jgi:hypothetical protein
MDITYILSLTVTRPVHLETADWMVSEQAQHELEMDVLQALRSLGGDCDCYVMEVSRETTQAEDDAAAGNPREKGADDGVEFSDPRDARDGRE